MQEFQRTSKLCTRFPGQRPEVSFIIQQVLTPKSNQRVSSHRGCPRRLLPQLHFPRETSLTWSWSHSPGLMPTFLMVRFHFPPWGHFPHPGSNHHGLQEGTGGVSSPSCPSAPGPTSSFLGNRLYRSLGWENLPSLGTHITSLGL